ncbi:putative stage III sporulation protein AH [Clostridium sp. CAG:921]|nr:putative stage III sporulation protein AH [Clostridium sp. CAG:921]
MTDKKEINNESDKTSNDSISVFRYDRDNMFSEMSENYNKIIANENTSKDQVNEYQKKLNSLIEEKNLITMVENVIKSKGIDDIVIIPTSNDNINVVISSKEELKKDQIAIIQQILVDQLGANANKISITTKN